MVKILRSLDVLTRRKSQFYFIIFLLWVPILILQCFVHFFHLNSMILSRFSLNSWFKFINSLKIESRLDLTTVLVKHEKIFNFASARLPRESLAVREKYCHPFFFNTNRNITLSCIWGSHFPPECRRLG
jgi:hypothetical protein